MRANFSRFLSRRSDPGNRRSTKNSRALRKPIPIWQVSHGVRTYAAIEGDYDVAELAQRHGLKLWQGIWLGADRVKNTAEMARGIELAHKYPDTITRVVVGNEVLLRRDLPPVELMADIDQVRAAVKQPVAYADVWDFWRQFPEVAQHVDLMMIHLLPYWEDDPTGIDTAVDHVGAVYRQMRAEFPGKTIAIGETGWPSAGRARRDAVPSRVNAARFLRSFIALSAKENFDYNFIEAFDQEWKYENEGRVGANWGIFDSSRALKIPLSGEVSNLPQWPAYAALSIVCGILLALSGGFSASAVVLGMALGAALGIAAADTWPFLYDWRVRGAALINVAGQIGLAIFVMRPGALAQPWNGARAIEALRNFGKSEFVPLADGLFLFMLAAAVNQGLLASDGRYRDFPFGAYAVPLVIIAARLCRGGRWHKPQLVEAIVAASLAAGAVASAIIEGPLNSESLAWNFCALVLAAGLVLQPWGSDTNSPND